MTVFKVVFLFRLGYVAKYIHVAKCSPTYPFKSTQIATDPWNSVHKAEFYKHKNKRGHKVDNLSRYPEANWATFCL